jgi:hypothetical protein
VNELAFHIRKQAALLPFLAVGSRTDGWMNVNRRMLQGTSTVRMLQYICYSASSTVPTTVTSTVHATVQNLVYSFLIQRPRQQGTVLFIRALPQSGHRISARNIHRLLTLFQSVCFLKKRKARFLLYSTVPWRGRQSRTEIYYEIECDPCIHPENPSRAASVRC